MRSNAAIDQAEGLRRLLLRASAPVVTVAGATPGLGATSLVANLAAILARAGKEVLVLDENLSHDNLGNMLALRPRYDLLNAVRRDKPLHEIVLHARQGVRILPVARAMRTLPQLSMLEREHLSMCLAEASRGMDVVLVDAAAGEECHISAGLAPEQPLLLVLNATPAAITESYALIKRMALQDGRQSFEVVVNRVQGEAEARAVYENLAQVAKRHLHVRIAYLGYIPADGELQQATRMGRPVVEAFPGAPAARAIEDLGGRLMPATGGADRGGLPDVVQRLIRQARSPIMAYAN